MTLAAILIFVLWLANDGLRVGRFGDEEKDQ